DADRLLDGRLDGNAQALRALRLERRSEVLAGRAFEPQRLDARHSLALPRHRPPPRRHRALLHQPQPPPRRRDRRAALSEIEARGRRDMSIGGPAFILAIIAMSMVGWMATTWM